jgi:hypothetical protein
MHFRIKEGEGVTDKKIKASLEVPPLEKTNRKNTNNDLMILVICIGYLLHSQYFLVVRHHDT